MNDHCTSQIEHRVHHKVHNTDPVRITFDGSSLESISYLRNGKLHRTNGPARIRYQLDGSISTIEYYLRGVLHREDGPAYITYHSYRTVASIKLIATVSYYVNGKRHRVDGPAFIHRFVDGLNASYYLDDNLTNYLPRES